MESNRLFPEMVDNVNPPAAYIGGKRRLATRLCRAIDRTPHRQYCEVFMGMGGVFFRRTRVPAAEFINDWSEDVATLFRVLQRHYVAFLDMLRFQITTREGFERLIRLDPSTQTDLERAARFLYLQRLAYGGKVSGRSFGIDPFASGGFDATKVAPLLEAIHLRLASVTIERMPWDRFIVAYDRPGTLFYLDPPYWGNEGDYGKGMFGREQFAAMAEQLARIRGRFLLSLNDRPEVHETFAAFAIEAVSTSYTIGGGRKVKPVSELIISGGG